MQLACGSNSIRILTLAACYIRMPQGFWTKKREEQAAEAARLAAASAQQTLKKGRKVKRKLRDEDTASTKSAKSSGNAVKPVPHPVEEDDPEFGRVSGSRSAQLTSASVHSVSSSHHSI